MTDAAPASTTEWARNHGTRYTYRAALDNYPTPRDYAHGELWFYVHPTTGTHGVILDGRASFRDATHAVYLLDDGQSVAPYFVAAWHPKQDHLILHPFPLSAGTRPDNGRPVDMSGWLLGPRRAYHLKISEAK